MKALSLWQPWASFIVWGEKANETRGWSTTYRGEVAIHAAKKWDAEIRDYCLDPWLYRVLEAHGAVSTLVGKGNRPDGPVFNLPVGCILALVDLVDVIPTEEATEKIAAGDLEYVLGDYSPGRFAWVFRNVRPLRQPLIHRSQQGLYTLPDDVAAEARRLAR